MNTYIGWPSLDELLSKAEESLSELDTDDLLSEDAWRRSDYAMYGVDNDFDLIEALYSDYVNSDPHELDSIRFHELRIECAMNPEYTDKCLASPAFADVRDEILMKLGRCV